jgi:transposase
MAQQRQQYTREFKVEAVRLVVEEERPLAQVARELGIARNLLQRWKRELEGAGAADALPGNGKLLPKDEEIRRLRRELEQVRQERDLLKSGGVLCQGVAVKYACIGEHRQAFEVRLLCRVLGVSRAVPKRRFRMTTKSEPTHAVARPSC